MAEKHEHYNDYIFEPTEIRAVRWTSHATVGAKTTNAELKRGFGLEFL